MDDLMRNALIRAHRGTHARPSRVALATGRAMRVAHDNGRRAMRLAREHSRWALGSALVGGSVVSLLLGMTIAGAFSGVDVALPPAGSQQASPRIEYAAPSNSSRSHDAAPPHPATSSHGATTTTGAPTTTAAGASNAAAPTTSPPTTAPSSSGSSGSGGTTDTTVPSTTTPTSPPTTVPSSPTTTVPSGPIHRILG